MNYKYDKKENRMFQIIAITMTVLFLLAIIVLIIEDMASTINVLGVVAALLLYACPLPTLMSWYGFLDSSRYIKRLKEGGVEVPYDRKADPIMADPPVYAEEEQDSKGSMVLAVICLCITLGLAIYTIGYYIKWTKLGMWDIGFFTVMQAVAVILWALAAALFYMQRSKEKYRDDTVFDPGRKQRMGVLKGIATIAVCMGITFAGFSVLASMTKYVYYSRLQQLHEGEDWSAYKGEPLIRQ